MDAVWGELVTIKVKGSRLLLVLVFCQFGPNKTWCQHFLSFEPWNVSRLVTFSLRPHQEVLNLQWFDLNWTTMQRLLTIRLRICCECRLIHTWFTNPFKFPFLCFHNEYCMIALKQPYPAFIPHYLPSLSLSLSFGWTTDVCLHFFNTLAPEHSWLSPLFES